jgi:hypothetical protein
MKSPLIKLRVFRLFGVDRLDTVVVHVDEIRYARKKGLGDLSDEFAHALGTNRNQPDIPIEVYLEKAGKFVEAVGPLDTILEQLDRGS